MARRLGHVRAPERRQRLLRAVHAARHQRLAAGQHDELAIAQHQGQRLVVWRTGFPEQFPRLHAFMMAEPGQQFSIDFAGSQSYKRPRKDTTMSGHDRSRRAFLRQSLSGLGAAWAVANAAGIAEAAAFAQQGPRASSAQAFSFFTAAQAAEVEAMAAQIIPTDSTPGRPRSACGRTSSTAASSTFEKEHRPTTRRG